ncbi:PREDICTED: uncharacterized protein LOC109230032 [Nicotiana attenuata]|uniref:uncharacterized protein LOC109230032 n=1 Tax=Nicotiana attenuata TaxID=49451 RepID=UPI00090485AC|nr:PREDICTED: uncharacterized protein LOC109230032 [Nicotiana attenuata]
MIFGGAEVNEVTFTAPRKMNILVTHGKRIREESEDDGITFSEEDVDGLTLPYNDALLSIVIGYNVVVVPKLNNKFRMCIDFKDLNKACLENSFPLLNIDQMIDAKTDHELMGFLDAYSGCNQIRMHTDDQEKISFITNFGAYCYNVMPFGLKNAGATYQRLVNKMFERQIGKTMEVYIDDMLVKSLNIGDHLLHLQETFDVLRNYNMKLNPEKYAF